MTHLHTKLGLFAKVIINPTEPFYTEENLFLKFLTLTLIVFLKAKMDLGSCA